MPTNCAASRATRSVAHLVHRVIFMHLTVREFLVFPKVLPLGDRSAWIACVDYWDAAWVDPVS